jgi:anti-anti-sigma factor
MITPLSDALAKVERSGNVTVITLTGVRKQDAEAMIALELKRRTENLGERHLLLDFTNVESLNSDELETMIRLHRQSRDGGGRLTLFNLSPDVFEVFTATHLDTLLGICREDKAELEGRRSS